jgi:SAM-dependent methyltransferase
MTAATEGVEYWAERARKLGARSVLGLDHDTSVDAVTDRHRAILLPILGQLIPTGGTPPLTVLDLGCGVGRLTGDLAALAGRAIGVDPVAEMLALAPAARGVSYRRLEDPAGPLPLATGEADVAFTCLVLGGIEGDALAHASEELRRVLAPGGLLLLAESVSEQPDAGHWTFRTVAEYSGAFAWARLEKVAEFDDAGDAVSVMVGRAPE